MISVLFILSELKYQMMRISFLSWGTKGSMKPNVFSPLLQINGICPHQSFGVEFMLTLQFVPCVLAITDRRQGAF